MEDSRIGYASHGFKSARTSLAFTTKESWDSEFSSNCRLRFSIYLTWYASHLGLDTSQRTGKFTVWKLQKFTLRFLLQKLREINS